jgi:hypothetical protein
VRHICSPTKLDPKLRQERHIRGVIRYRQPDYVAPDGASELVWPGNYKYAAPKRGCLHPPKSHPQTKFDTHAINVPDKRRAQKGK